jgi:hypothetical protein
MELAISALKNQEISSIREAARVFNVSCLTLQTRLHDTLTRLESRANSYKIT